MFRALHQPWAFWLLSSLMFLLWEPLSTATGLHAIVLSSDNPALQKKKEKHTKATPAVHREASQSKSSCCVHVRRTFCCFLSLSLAPEGMCGRRDGWTEGWREGGSLLFVSPSLRLFGEFADDTDQCSIFIFKTLVVGSQVDQDLVVKVELPLETN